ncbi:MAG TPA: aspartate carbamoyltransferase catalytic subunit [Deltaproteobacteria bacterium]|nr:aspartate carbamoyltransferase catalytic subunit [Deltaproteobacteria bacterium]
MRLKRKDILTIEELERDELEMIFSSAASFKEVSERDIKKVPTLRGRTIINLFYEPSTRTRTAFEIAGKRMSADVINISASASSVKKGETLMDTAKNLEAMKPDCIVIRHSSAGASHILAGLLSCSVINAGDGAHEHPTQALLDIFTIKERFGRVEGLKVLIVGDILHSRVARSNIWGLKKLGAEVTVCGPPTMIPPHIERLGCSVTYNIDHAIEDADVIIMLRIQLERQRATLFPSLREYARCWGLSAERLKRAKKDVLIMHPGPVNRGVELSPEVIDGPWSVILEQVTNGVAVRMALFYLLLGGVKED